MPPQLKLVDKYSLHRNSPSLLYNNLYPLGDNAFVYLSGNTVFRSTPGKKDLSCIASYTEPVINYFAAFFEQYGNVVAIVNQLSVDLYVSDKICVSLVYDKYALTRSIGVGNCVSLCLDKTGMICLFIGTSTGDLIYTDYDPLDSGDRTTRLVPKSSTNTHKLRSITALDASHNYFYSPARIVSADIGGNVVMWDKDRQPYCVIPSLDSESECATAVKICGEGKLAAVSFGNGKVILYSTADGHRNVEICAHARWINTMACFHGFDAARRGDLLATAGEDGTVQLFKVDHSDGEVAALVCWLTSIQLSDVIPTGLCFEAGGKSIALSCYDIPSISVFAVSDL
ncbi:unnamed protein product [Phytomonas sp. EM1]|nr:unnamed protein product [Phytomonas sp. EM1]|eukprot:CCW61060.1 unnamed protein product [Phytomonas sp. isolate EM1]